MTELGAVEERKRAVSNAVSQIGWQFRKGWTVQNRPMPRSANGMDSQLRKDTNTLTLDHLPWDCPN